MDRRSSRTSLPNISNNDSGIGIGSIASNASQLAPEDGAHGGVQEAIQQPAPTREILANAVLTVAVQESGDNEGDIYVNPPAEVLFRSDGDYITTICFGDIDIPLAKALQRRFRQLLLAIERCRTCFTCRRGVINYPCMCLCNCQHCAQVMEVCSLCYSRIDLAIPVVFQYAG